MYAIVEHGGKQYVMRPGRLVRLEKIDQAPGTVVEFTNVHLVRTEDPVAVAVGQPLHYVVKATIRRHERAKKLIVFKKRRKEQYKKKQGHRQWMTVVYVEAIEPRDAE
ncbi:MAG: 50S ribosomal protein L21 [Acidobacteria bacterium]|nr:50S ribosomal protein L21 [Acidobacteriota bacterium]MDW7983699.1 50S ribosomal protein L21 [Acidobacteriota bacterium]